MKKIIKCPLCEYKPASGNSRPLVDLHHHITIKHPEYHKNHKTDGTKCWCNPRIESFKRYTIKEFSDSLYWICEGYWFKIYSKINGEVVKKVPIEHIYVDIAKEQEKDENTLIKERIKVVKEK
jgi:hypothetical protein